MATARMNLLAGMFVVIGLTTIAAAGLAQSGGDPRNFSEDYYDAVDDALCMAHHEQEGFRPVDVNIQQRYSMLPIGEVVDLEVRLRNPWLHQVLDLSLTVNTTNAPGLEVVTGDRPDNLENDNVVHGPVGPGAEQAFEASFPVQENASAVRVYAELIDPGSSIAGTLGQNPPRVHLELQKRSTDIKESESRAEIAFDPERIKVEGFGQYTVRAWVISDVDEDYSIRLGTFVDYNATSQTEFTFFAGDAVALRDGEGFTFRVPVIKHSQEEAIIDFAAQVRTNFEHPAGTNAANDGQFLRFTTMRVSGGDQLVLAANAAGPTLVGAQVDMMNLFTRIVGFLAILLVPIAMVTGGLFGKSSRRWLNNVTGGAKKRVLWHSAMSWMILITASVHFLIALLESKFLWDKGLFWGGVGWALLVTLGVTGYYQVRMIKRWNYKTWRHIHLWTAVGVFVFGGMHTFIDGSDLQGVRDTLTFLNYLIWP